MIILTSLIKETGMSLADDVQAINDTRRPTACKTGAWITGLDAHDQNAIRAYVTAGKPIAALWRAAIKNGYDGGLTQFKDHCGGNCCCARRMEAAA
jgi:hypothetical protein